MEYNNFGNKITKEQQDFRNSIINRGKFLKSVYASGKHFQWNIYEYKKMRYEVSMFNDEFNLCEHYSCEGCGKTYYVPYIKYISFYGMMCKRCAKEVK